MSARPAPPVFLDRDGTVIVDKRYLGDPDGVELETGAVEGLWALARAGHALIVLSNQSGIGRGFISRSDADRVNEKVAAMLRARGIEIKAWYVCPHAPGAGCECRKPAPGLALQAARELNLELDGSYVVGDKRSDVELADAVGGTGILVLTGQSAQSVDWARANSRIVADNLAAAARCIAARSADAARETQATDATLPASAQARGGSGRRA